MEQKDLTIGACGQQSPGLDRRSGLRYGSRVVVPAYLGVAQHRGRCLLIGRQRGPVLYGRPGLLFFTGHVVPRNLRIPQR